MEGKKTCIGVITSHDDLEKNNNLVALLEFFLSQDKEILKNYMFVFTGGTYDRVILGKNLEDGKNKDNRSNRPIDKEAYRRLVKWCGVIRLETGRDGGVTRLSDLVVKRFVSILWFYLSPRTHHWLIPENLALIRLCDQWSVKRLMTWGSITEWIKYHAEFDMNFNPVHLSDPPLQIYLDKKDDLIKLSKQRREEFVDEFKEEFEKKVKEEFLKRYLDKKDVITNLIKRCKEKLENEFKEELENEFKEELEKKVKEEFLKRYLDKNDVTPKLIKQYREEFEKKSIKNWEKIDLEIAPNFKKSLEKEKEKKKEEKEDTSANDNQFKDLTISLIAHDAMKEKMMEFAVYYERELSKFNKIITTGTTGKLIAEAAPLLAEAKKDNIALIKRYHSGPKGGDIEISAQILMGKCHIIIFFIDTLNPHPHIDDIRNVFASCMTRDDVIMLSNEIHAREWFERRMKKR